MAHKARGVAMSDRQARDEAVKRGAAARLLSTMQLPWSDADTFTDPHATIAVGFGSAAVHTAERLGIVSRDHAAGTWRRVFPSPEAEAEWMGKFRGESA